MSIFLKKEEILVPTKLSLHKSKKIFFHNNNKIDFEIIGLL